VVAIPGYFSRLVPEIGVRNAWLYVGWRQAVWDGQRQESGSKSRRIPVRQIIRFSGLSRRTFFRAIEDEMTWKSLLGLVERSDEKPLWAKGRDKRAHRLPNHYTVHMTLPLSQADAASVFEWLENRLQEGLSLLDALRQANAHQDLVGEILHPIGVPAPEKLKDIPRSVMAITKSMSGLDGDLSADLRDAAETLHRRITSAFGTILMTHYFLETVISNAALTPAQAWLVALLRDRCYINQDTGEVRDEVLVRGGYGELADWLGLNRSKTIWEWIRDEQGPVSAFLCILPSQERDDVDSLRIQVRLDEPIFDGANGTISMARMAPVDGAVDTHKDGADGTHTMAQLAPMEGADDTNGWREWHRLKHLNTSHKPQKRVTTTTQDDPAAAVPSSWVLRKILIQSRVHPKVAKDLHAKNASVKAFVSWLLYAFSPAGEGIQNPLAYALASLRDNPDRGPGNPYDRLADLPPAELIPLVRWSVRRAARKYDFQAEDSGNEIWDKAMGFSERHGTILAILLGEDEAAQTIERRKTEIFQDGEKTFQEIETIRTCKR
jgi:predicted DNA-binding transcriptional regulator AlpA